MPLACDLYPQFEYVGSAPRKLGLALAFIVAGASGIAIFMADSSPDPDPMNSMALAPVEALNSEVSASPAGTGKTQAAEAAVVQKPPKAGASKLPCQENTAENLGGDCSSSSAPNLRSVQAVSDPSAAAVPIGHRDGPALLPSDPAILVAAAPDGPDRFTKPADAEPATNGAPSAVVESPTSAPSIKKARTRSSHVQRRVRNTYSPSPRYGQHNYYQSGYARVW